MPFLFHQVPERMHGDRIYPLNELQKINRRLYLREFKKYRRRAHVARTIIPPLDCTWSNVVFLTAIHPAIWRRTFKALGEEVGGLRYYAIELSEINTQNLCVLLYDENGENSFVPFSPSNFGLYAEIPEEAIAYYRHALTTGEPLFWHHLVPQLLYKETIDVSNPTIVEA